MENKKLPEGWKRQPGYYWVKWRADGKWHIATYYLEFSPGKSWSFDGCDFIEEAFEEIDERQIVRQELPTKIPTRPEPKDLITRVIGKPLKELIVQDLTKPMGHEINKFQRNFFDSTI